MVAVVTMLDYDWGGFGDQQPDQGRRCDLVVGAGRITARERGACEE